MCSCRKGRKLERWIVTLPSKMKITKSSEDQARRFSEKHPGSTYAKAS